jgi:hypothetical protein
MALEWIFETDGVGSPFEMLPSSILDRRIKISIYHFKVIYFGDRSELKTYPIASALLVNRLFLFKRPIFAVIRLRQQPRHFQGSRCTFHRRLSRQGVRMAEIGS